MTTGNLLDRPLKLRGFRLGDQPDPVDEAIDDAIHEQNQDFAIHGNGLEIANVGGELKRQAQLLANVQAETPTPNAQLGPQRRLKIEVPTPAGGGTRLALGYRWEGMNYDGFGVDTAGHVVINARGGKTASTMSLQANGQILIQSDEDSVYLVSKKSAYVASAEGANVVAQQGVVIAGGFGGTVVNPPVVGSEPKAPEKTKDYAAWMADVGSFYSWTDSAFAAFGLVKSGYEIATSTKAGAFKGALLGNLVNLGNIANNVGGLIDGVTVHGKGGFTLGTPATGGIYAAASLTLGSAFTAMYGLQEVEVAGKNAAKLSSFGDAIVLGKGSASLLSRGKVEVASRGDEVDIQGTFIRMGNLSPAPDGAQRATTHSRVYALNSIKIQTTKKDEQPALGIHMDAYHSMHLQAKLDVRVESRDEKLDIVAKKGIAITSEEKVRAGIDDNLHIEVNKQQKSIQMRSEDARALMTPNVIRMGFQGQGLELTKKGVYRLKGKKLHLL